MSKSLRILFVAAFFLFLLPPHLRAEDSSQAPTPSIQALLAQNALFPDSYKPDLNELKAFYAARNGKTAWGTENQPDSAKLTSFLESIESVASYHGLRQEPEAETLAKQLIASQNPADRAKLDILFSDMILKLAHALHGDTINPANLYPGWRFSRPPVAIVAGLNKAIEEQDLAGFTSSLAPKEQAYTDLANGLKTYRAYAEKGPWPKIKTGPTLRAGQHDPRILEVRARLAAEDYLPETEPASDLFDDTLKNTIIAYQIRNGLQADGDLGAKTVATLNVPLAKRIDQILANMERWRHMPESLPEDYAWVNIPDMTVALYENGKAVYRGPVVIGRPDRKTPFIQSALRSVIFNPSWHVPTKIARKDILPKLRKDPHYLEKLGFVINGSADDPHGDQIDWKKIKESEFNFRLRQSPGDINALGRLKFDFDNDFSVYMHGTPHQELFAKPERAQSSGCIRLRDPDVVAQVVLAGNEGNWSLDHIHQAIDSAKTKWLKIENPLPLYVVYWTVFTDENTNKLAFRSDIYDYDSFLMESLAAQSSDSSSKEQN
jgi:murein L,D-transpeptidase YcbB/YkuD